MKLVEQTEDTRSDVEKAVHNFNVVAKAVNGSQAKKITPDRERRLKKLLAAVGGLESWNEALENVEMSAFLRGEVAPRDTSSSPFKFNMEFMLVEKNFMKLWEGVYND